MRKQRTLIMAVESQIKNLKHDIWQMANHVIPPEAPDWNKIVTTNDYRESYRKLENMVKTNKVPLKPFINSMDVEVDAVLQIIKKERDDLHKWLYKRPEVFKNIASYYGLDNLKIEDIAVAEGESLSEYKKRLLNKSHPNTAFTRKYRKSEVEKSLKQGAERYKKSMSEYIEYARKFNMLPLDFEEFEKELLILSSTEKESIKSSIRKHMNSDIVNVDAYNRRFPERR